MRLWKWFVSWRAKKKAKRQEKIMKRLDELEEYVRY